MIVLDVAGHVMGYGQLLARNTLMGRLIGHLVAMENGTRLTIAPVQLREIDNVVIPPADIWRSWRSAERPQ